MEKSFAQQMLEQLSDNVSNLILTVLELKDKNANLPVIEITAIANASTSVADISIGLANSEYSNYPEIYNEIISTASNMSKIKNSTLESITSFNKNNNKQQAWNNLITSCKNIANETYKILQVIYDADIKRLKYLNKICKDEFKINENSFYMIDKEEFNEFGEQINKSISNVLEFSSCIDVKAKEINEMVPNESMEILNRSKQLVEDANSLIDIVNDIFNDIDDPSQKSKFINHQNKLIIELDQLLSIIELNSTSLQSLTEPSFTNINNIIQSPIPSQYSTSNTHHQEDNNNNNNNTTQTEESSSLLTDLIRSISKSCIEEFRATCRNDSIATDIISNSIQQLSIIFEDTLNDWCKALATPEQSSTIKQSIDKLKNTLLPKYIETAKLITSSNNSSLKNNLNETNQMIEMLDNIQDNLNLIGSIVCSKEDQFLNTIKAKEDTLTILSDHSIGDNTSAIVGTLKHLAKNQTKLEAMVHTGDEDESPTCPAEINEAISKLSELLPLQIQAAKLYLKDNNNPDARKQFTDISDSMKIPLSKIKSLMEPNSITDSELLLANQLGSINSIINAAKSSNLKLLESLLKDQELNNAKLVSIVESETSLNDDSTDGGDLLNQLIKNVINQLLEQVSLRRSLANKLLKQPNDTNTELQLIKNNDTIIDLSKSLTDCLKSFETIPLLKLQLLDSIKQPQQHSKSLSIQKDINNRLNAIIYNYPNQDELKLYQNQFNQELSSTPSNKNVNNLNYILDNIINVLNNLNKNDNNNNNTTTTHPPSLNIIEESINETLEKENNLILNNFENEKKREQERENEFKNLEKLSNDQKLLKLFNDLILHLKNSEANKSMLTLKQLISEQDKLIQLANEIKEKSKSKDFKDQIDSSIQLFKNSVSLAIGLAGKANLSENQIPLSKATKTVKKSIIELTHLLKLNNSIEELSNWQSNGGLKNSNQPINDNIINGFKEHQLNSRYYIQTAYEVDKDDLISESIEKIVYQQSELLLLATDYLVSKEFCEKVDPNIQLLLANSLQTVKKSIIDQVESALSFLDDKKQHPEESIEKLLTILDTVAESVENCSKSIFYSTGSISTDTGNRSPISQETIKQSINSIIPSLTLISNKLQSNPNDKELELKHQSLLDQIIQPLEQLILNPNINQIINESDKTGNGIDGVDDSGNDNDDEIEKIKKLINDEKKELDKLETNALESDSKGVVESSRALVRLHQEIISIADGSGSNGREDNEIIKECSKELSTLIPLQLQTIKSMLQSKDIPTEASFQKKASHINNQIKRNLNEIENQLCKPTSSTSSSSNNTLILLPTNNKTPYYRDQFKKVSKIIDNNGIVNKDENQFKNNLKKLEKIAEKCIDSANYDLSKSNSYLDSDKQKRIRDAINQLEKRLNGQRDDNDDLSSKINNYSKQPLNPTAREQFEKSRNSFQQTLDKLIDESTLSTPLQLLTNHSNLIQKLIRHSTNSNNGSNPNGNGKVQEISKQILENYQKLKLQLIDGKDGIKLINDNKKSIILKSLKEIENITPQLIVTASSNASSNSGNRELLENLQTQIESPIAEILHQLDSIDPVYKFDDIVKQHQSTITKLNNAIDSNDSKQVDELLLKLSNLQNQNLIPFLKQQELYSGDGTDIENQLKSKLLDVESISKDYLKQGSSGSTGRTDGIKAEKDMAISSLRNIMNSIHSNKMPEIENKRNQLSLQSQSKSKNIQQLVANIKSNNLLPIVDSPNKIERFVSIQTKTNQPVFSNNRVTSTASVNVKPRTNSLTNSNSSTKPTPTPKPVTPPPKVVVVNKPIETRVPVKLTTTTPSAPISKPTPTPTPTVSKPQPKPISSSVVGSTLEDSFINAANQISNSDNEQVGSIAKELEQYAKSVKNGDKRQMLVCSKNISMLLNKYSLEISNTSKSSNVTNNKMIQSRLGHSSGILQTLSCQFKILTSVKAASDEKDSDSDSQLTSLVNQLTTTLLDINTTVNIINKTTTTKK